MLRVFFASEHEEIFVVLVVRVVNSLLGLGEFLPVQPQELPVDAGRPEGGIDWHREGEVQGFFTSFISYEALRSCFPGQ